LSRPIAILAVIVLYKKKLDESPALRSLRASLECLDKCQDLRLKILIYENESSGIEAGVLPGNVVYHSSPCNGGLVSAYNFALRMATTEGFDWLLTLDQDSTVPQVFVSHLATIAKEILDQEEIAAIVPHVLSRKIFISPHFQKRGRWVRLTAEFDGIPEGEVCAINSGTTWRTSALREVGGFNPLFWLDYLDHWLFREIQRAGKLMYAAGNLRIEHELSLLNGEYGPSPERYENILGAESAFCDLYKSAMDGLLFDAKLLAISLNQLVRRGNGELSRVAWNCLKERILLDRRARIEKRKDMISRQAAQGEPVSTSAPH
jgi:GT2 family glycosyltransferase